MNLFNLVFCVLSILYTVSEASSGEHWDYNNIDDWSHSFPTCGGKAQSPVDFDEDDLKSRDGSSPVLNTNTKVSSEATLKNNGHTVQLNFEPGRFSVSGMNLPYKYQIDQLHFHWGSNNNQGSEHTVDGNAFPMEMHVVSHNSKFPTLSEAVDSGESDALAVMGFFYEVSSYNDYLEPIIDQMPLKIGSTAKVIGFDLYALIKDAFQTPYMRYSGSLTTPTCNEVVVWTVFEQTLTLSPSQIAKFRDPNTGIVDNFRPTQPLNGRNLYLED